MCGSGWRGVGVVADVIIAIVVLMEVALGY